jgi:DNA-binding GntR family transcriptional regulator
MPRLMRAIDDLHVAGARFLFSGWSAEWETPTDRDHRAILVALRAGDIDRAASLLERHVTWPGAMPRRRRSPPAR